MAIRPRAAARAGAAAVGEESRVVPELVKGVPRSACQGST